MWVFQQTIFNGGKIPTSVVGSSYRVGAYVLRFGLRSLGIGSSAAVRRNSTTLAPKALSPASQLVYFEYLRVGLDGPCVVL